MSNRAFHLSFIFLVCFLSFSDAFAKNGPGLQRSVPEDKYLALLLKGNYKELDKNLQQLQKNYLADRTKENDLHKALYMFYRSNQSVGNKLQEWVERQPNNAMAYLSRGIYRTKVGWEARGGSFSSETSQYQFNGMAAWFNLAKADLSKAAALDPSLVEAYCYQIEIDMNEGGEKLQALFDQALKINPASFIAREYFIHSQLPRWGGSYEEMKKTVADAKPFYKDCPQLRALEGRILVDMGELAAYRKDFKSALQYLREGLAYGDFWFHNQKYGEALWEVDDYKGAIEQFNLVIQYKPGYKQAWWMRAQAYKMLNQFPEALADINYAIGMEPNDDQAIAARGYILQMSGNLKAALEDFRQAAKLDPSNAAHQDAIKEIELLMAKAKLVS